MIPSLVLLHGASGCAATWSAEGWPWARVLAPDLPGRGRSPGPALPDVRALAGWLDGALAGVEAPVMVGHSLGGAVGLQLALDRPDALRALVLVSSSARLRVHPLILQAVADATPEAPFRLDAAFGPGTPQEVLDDYAEASARTPPQSALADWRACDAFDVRERLAEVQVPTLVLHGDRDALTPPKFQRALAEALPSATRVSLPGVGHMLPWEAPEAFEATVRRWVEAL